MQRYKIERYICKIDMVIKNELFLKGDEIFIQECDHVSVRDQQVFNSKRERVCEISPDYYYSLIKEFEKV